MSTENVTEQNLENIQNNADFDDAFNEATATEPAKDPENTPAEPAPDAAPAEPAPAEDNAKKADGQDVQNNGQDDQDKADFSFLDDLDDDPKAGQTQTPDPENNPAPNPGEPEDKKTDTPPAAGNSAPETPADTEDLMQQILADLPENLKSYAADFPEETKFFHAYVQAAVKKLTGNSQNADLNARLQALEDSAQKNRQAEEYQKVTAEIQKTHPDVLEIVNSRPFADWLKAQPKTVQRIARDTSDPADVCWLIGNFKASDTAAKNKINSRAALYQNNSGNAKPHTRPAQNPQDEYDLAFSEGLNGK